MRLTRLLSVVTLAVLGAVTGVTFPVSRGVASAAQAERPRSGPDPAPKAITGGDERPPAPIALSDPDGQEMALDELTVRAAVHGMLSLTEMELRFRNPQPRRMEGRFTCILPAGAAVSRFAKEVNGQLMEGEVVERLKANQVYDTILHEMRDPALLEQDQGNRFSARVFPIEANASVRLVLSYSRLLPLANGSRTYAFPLRGLPTIGRFRFQGTFAPLPGEEASATGSRLSGPVSGRHAAVETFTVDEARYTPTEDLAVTWKPTGGTPAVRALRAGDFVLTAFRVPEGRSQRAAESGPWIFHVDTSASGADGILHRGQALARLLGALPASDPVEIWAFDQEVVKIGGGTAGEWAGRIEAALSDRGLLGGTDLESALRSMASRAKARPGARLVLVSDGVATLGRTDRSALLSAVQGIPAASPFHALVLGSRQDAETLAALVAGRGRVVTLAFTESMREEAVQAAARLRLPPGLELRVSDPAAEWLYPAEAHDAQPGDEVIVLSKVRAAAEPAANLLRGGVTVGSAAGATPLPAGPFQPLLEREAYRAYLATLSAREARETDAAVRSALATEQVKVSVERRILIPSTTLLVLESEADYARFGLERRALASILTVGPAGIERLDRRAPVLITQPEKAGAPAESGTLRRKDGPAPKRESRSAAATSDRAEEVEKKEQAAASSGGGSLPAAPPAVGAESRARVVRDADGRQVGSKLGEAQAPTLSVQAQPPARFAEPAPPSPAPRGNAATGQSAPAPARPAPISRPTDGLSANEEDAAETTGRRRAVARPEWTRPARPTPSELGQLRDRVAASPLDRRGHNALTDALFAVGAWKELREAAIRWQRYDPENPQVYEMLGEAARELGRTGEALRAFGSLVELAPGKPELLQRAGLLLFRAGDRVLCEAPLRRALELRPDRVNAYRHLALVLWQAGRVEAAARILEDATGRAFPDWYGNAQRVVREELAYVYRAWIAKSPAKAEEIRRRAIEHGADLARRDAVRVTLAWDTDANDVDLHVVDPDGEECFYSHRATAAGLTLYEDITRGFGPEVVRSRRRVGGTYSVGVNYFSSGPMGVSRGVLVVMEEGAGPDAAPTVTLLPFRLVEGGRDMRLLATLDGGSPESPRKPQPIAR